MQNLQYFSTVTQMDKSAHWFALERIPEWAYLQGYWVSRDGEVASCRRGRGYTSDVFMLRPQPPDPSKRDYLYVMLPKPRGEGRQQRTLVHTLVARCFIGPRPAGLVIDHRDQNRHHNWASNLEYVTPKENTRRAREYARMSRDPRYANFFKNVEVVAADELRTSSPYWPWLVPVGYPPFPPDADELTGSPVTA